MSYEIPGDKIGTLLAGADLSAKQFYFVTVDAAGVVQLVGAGGTALGVLQNKPTAGQVCDIMSSGVSKVIAGAAVGIGDNVTPDGSGRAVTATTGDYIRGKALEAASAAGQYIAVALVPQGISA